MKYTITGCPPLHVHCISHWLHFHIASRGSGEGPYTTYTENSERMILKHAKNVKTHKFAVGDYASFCLPCIDQTSTTFNAFLVLL